MTSPAPEEIVAAGRHEMDGSHDDEDLLLLGFEGIRGRRELA